MDGHAVVLQAVGAGKTGGVEPPREEPIAGVLVHQLTDGEIHRAHLAERTSIEPHHDRREAGPKKGGGHQTPYMSQQDKKSGECIAQESNGFPDQVIAPGVRRIAATFVALHEARETADYDDAATVQHTEALAAVQQVEQAFRAFLTVQTEPSAVTLLQELLCRGIIKR